MADRDAFIYEIRVAERLSDRWAEWLEGMHMHSGEGNETILTGALPDQSALYGVLWKVHNLGLTLVSVRRITRGG